MPHTNQCICIRLCACYVHASNALLTAGRGAPLECVHSQVCVGGGAQLTVASRRSMSNYMRRYIHVRAYTMHIHLYYPGAQLTVASRRMIDRTRAELRLIQVCMVCAYVVCRYAHVGSAVCICVSRPAAAHPGLYGMCVCSV